MSTLTDRALAFGIRRSKQILKANRTTRRLLYDIANQNAFTDTLGHERMLADTVRMDAYADAIRRNVRPGDVVLDLGTGTGILALFAARQQPAHIYAIDHSDFLDVARRIAAQNGAADIEFVQTHSRSFQPAEQLDVILHEQMGDNLFDEHMVENILDLKQRLLKPGGRILPAKFELYLEPVTMRPQYRMPYLWEQRIHGVDFSFLKDDEDLVRHRRGGYGHVSLHSDVVDHFLGAPEPILAFDLNELTDGGALTLQPTVSRTVTRPGRLDGVCLYFRVIFDDEVSFDTSPIESLTHWTNALFRLPSREYEAGERISYAINAPDLTDATTWAVSLVP